MSADRRHVPRHACEGAREIIDELTAERDRLRDAIEAIPRHAGPCPCGHTWCPIKDECSTCCQPWPCVIEQAHIAAAATNPQATP